MLYNERDVELPALLNFVDKHKDKIKTALDVGCAGSLYLHSLKKRIQVVNGIDLISYPTSEKILDNYWVGDAIRTPLEKHDLVVSISTMEHVGISPYKADNYLEEQDDFFRTVYLASSKFIFMSFPFGIGFLPVESFQNITNKQLSMFLTTLESDSYQLAFYHNEQPAVGKKWVEISREEASRETYMIQYGVRTVCHLEVEK